MARVHPSFPLKKPLNLGDYRERDVLLTLQEGLPQGYDIFHSLPWSTVQEDKQNFGEIDLVVVSPGAEVLSVEVKAGDLAEVDGKLTKTYFSKSPKDVGQQAHRQRSALVSRLSEEGLGQIPVGSVLVLPDYRIQSTSLSYPRERIVDASQMEDLVAHIKSMLGQTQHDDDTRSRLMDFLSHRFQVQPDVASLLGHVQAATTQLGSGLATWVPKISHQDKTFVIEATAGSGKTQLALALLREIHHKKRKGAYVCFNRPLADHMVKLAPTSSDVITFHQLCREYAEKNGQQVDLSKAGVFDELAASFISMAEDLQPAYDLLIVDESQDFDLSWVDALQNLLRDDSPLYVMGDVGQQIYPRDAFDLNDAVRIECQDNFRSPRKIVELINKFKLSPKEVVSRSAYQGQMPHFYDYDSSKKDGLAQINQSLEKLWAEGYTPDQVCVVTFSGVKNSTALKQSTLGGKSVKKPTGTFDAAGNAIWTEGELKVDSIYRFKGQSAPAVVLCEVDFDELTEREKRKLFVGLTRGQLRVDLVMSNRAIELLLEAV